MSDELKQLEDYLLTIIKGIVNKPDEIKINFSDKEDEEKGEMTVITIRVARRDIPLCIGSGGSVADSIRRLAVLACRQIGYTEKNIFVRIDAPKIKR